MCHAAAADGLRGQVLAALTLTMDYHQAHAPGVGYALGHLWSLSVEEKFYLLWPLLLGLAVAGGRRRRLVVLGVATANAAVLGAAWLCLDWEGTGAFSSAYFRADTRASGLLAGCVLALVAAVAPTRLRPLGAPWAGLLALAVIAVIEIDPGLLGATGRQQAVLGFPLADLAACALVGHLALTRTGPAARLLSLPVLVRIGDLSYAFYLWHLPVLVVLVEVVHAGAVTAAVAGGLTSLGLAHLTALVVERPLQPAMRRLRRPGPSPAGPAVRALHQEGHAWPG